MKVEICADVCLHLLQVVIFICIINMLVSEMDLDVSYIVK